MYMYIGTALAYFQSVSSLSAVCPKSSAQLTLKLSVRLTSKSSTWLTSKSMAANFFSLSSADNEAKKLPQLTLKSTVQLTEVNR